MLRRVRATSSTAILSPSVFLKYNYKLISFEYDQCNANNFVWEFYKLHMLKSTYAIPDTLYRTYSDWKSFQFPEFRSLHCIGEVLRVLAMLNHSNSNTSQHLSYSYGSLTPSLPILYLRYGSLTSRRFKQYCWCKHFDSNLLCDRLRTVRRIYYRYLKLK